MFTQKLKMLPEWESYSFTQGEEGEEWKCKVHLEAAKSLYNQWREVFQLVQAFNDTLPEFDEVEQISIDTIQLINEHAYFIAPKIMSAARDTLYEIKMENAALIRFNCRKMMELISFSVLVGDGDPEHKLVIEDAIEEFKLRFRHWVSLFKKDEYEDEWGLFI